MEKKDIIDELIAKKLLNSTGKNYLLLFNNIAISMYGARAWAFTIQQIAAKKGEKYIFDLGYLMGSDSANEIKENFKTLKSFLSKEVQLVPNLIEATGFGVISIKHYTPKKNVLLEIEANHILDYANKLYGEKSLVCSFYKGVYSGFFDVFLDLKGCKLKLKESVDKGDKKYILEFIK